MIKSKKKGIIGLTLTALAFVPLLAIGVTSFNNISPAYAADYDYNSERDGGEINENFDLTVTFTINNYDLAADFTRYWTVYLLDENTEMVFDENSHKLSDSMSRHRNAATYYFPYRDTGIDKEGTWTLTVKAENGRIILYPSFKHKSLEERAAEYGGQLNLDGELDWRGEPVGNEVW